MSDKEKINFKDKYETEAGRPVRVICIDYVEIANIILHPVIVLVTDIHGNESVEFYDQYGIPRDMVKGRKLIKYDPVKYLKENDPVYVSRTGAENDWIKAHFYGIDKSTGEYVTFKDGRSKWTGPLLTAWKYIKVPEPLQK